MTLSDKAGYKQIIGSLMINPQLLLEYSDITPADFDVKTAQICFTIIYNLYKNGATQLTPYEVDQELEKHPASYALYESGHGLEFLKFSYEQANIHNFETHYKRLKKYSLLRRLKKEHYDISQYYIDDKDIDDPKQASEAYQRFEDATLEDILNSVEANYNVIRNDYLHGGHAKGDPSENLDELIEELRTTPSIGPELEGTIFSTVCRGARTGCFYLKSSSSGSGKTRTSVFDACHIAFPKRWSFEEASFIEEMDENGEARPPRKILFIVTEMDKEELQTIMLAYLSGVNEDKILTGRYELNELARVKYAAKIIQEYHDYFIIEEISDPNLVNVSATIRKYATLDQVKYVFFDYIHSTASLVEQFARNNLREDVVLMLLANQLKQLAKDYQLFIFSATQVNMSAMADDGEFKNEMSIRASKAVADKADMGYVMSKISDKTWQGIVPTLRVAAREGRVDAHYLDEINRPTHVLDIYKMRRGRYKNVRIWTRIDLGTGERKDLFITTADNQPIGSVIDIFEDSYKIRIEGWANE